MVSGFSVHGGLSLLLSGLWVGRKHPGRRVLGKKAAHLRPARETDRKGPGAR
jgi:hypothetical protein